MDSLTAREWQVMVLIGNGKTSKEIAVLLGISPETVGNYRKNLCRKLNAHSTAELVASAVRRSIDRTSHPEEGSRQSNERSSIILTGA